MYQKIDVEHWATSEWVAAKDAFNKAGEAVDTALAELKAIEEGPKPRKGLAEATRKVDEAQAENDRTLNWVRKLEDDGALRESALFLIQEYIEGVKSHLKACEDDLSKTLTKWAKLSLDPVNLEYELDWHLESFAADVAYAKYLAKFVKHLEWISEAPTIGRVLGAWEYARAEVKHDLVMEMTSSGLRVKAAILAKGLALLLNALDGERYRGLYPYSLLHPRRKIIRDDLHEDPNKPHLFRWQLVCRNYQKEVVHFDIFHAGADDYLRHNLGSLIEYAEQAFGVKASKVEILPIDEDD